MTGGDGEPDRVPRQVSEEDRDRAQALYLEAVKLHQDLLFAQAADKYREALKYWEHPYTRFNLSKALGALGRSLEAYDNLMSVLPDLGRERDAGEAYRRKLLRSLSEVEAHCSEDGATVTLDGQPWLKCPGRASKVVLPGQHVLVASKPQFVTATEPVHLVAGKRGVVKLQLVSFADSTLTRTRFAWWKPWSVVGASVLVSAIGAGLTWKAGQAFQAFDEGWFNECGGIGCFDDDEADLLGDLKSAERYRDTGRIAFTLGGAALIAGVALLALNRPHAYLDESAGGAEIQIQPLISDDSAGVTAGFRF